MIAGIDLAGPKNHKDTAMAIINSGTVSIKSDLSDSAIFEIIRDNNIKNVGLDAPLSYSEEGGYRESDRELRTLLNKKGFTNIGVMAPTYSKMIYLTVRGIRLSRLLSKLKNPPNIYEGHPGAFLVLDNYPYNLVKTVKSSASSINELVGLIKSKGYKFEKEPESDHELMAVGVALAVEAKLNNKIHWEYKADALDDYLYIA